MNTIVLSEHHNYDEGFALKWPHNKINKTWGKRKAMSSLQLYVTKDTEKSIFPHCQECYLQIKAQNNGQQVAGHDDRPNIF